MSNIDKELNELLENASQTQEADNDNQDDTVRIQLEGKKKKDKSKKGKEEKQAKPSEPKAGKKKGKKDDQSQPDAPKEKKPKKIPFYFKSVFKTYNLITLLPITCLLYVVFFAIDISDGKGITFFIQNKTAMIVFMAIIGVALLVWAFITMRNKEVCSLDAFLLIGMLTGIGMLLQCFILGHFAPINTVAILTIIIIAIFAFLMTVRLALFKVHAQQEASDNVYMAKSKLGMYFKVVFTKYASFITMLVLFGIMIVFMLTREDVLEKFEYQASQIETIVTIAFAAAAVVMMVIALFIRLVRGKVNIVDCMPYIFYIVAVGSLLFFFTEKVYSFLYLAIACLIVGVVWLGVCQYTINVDRYKKVNRGVKEQVYVAPQPVIEEPIEEPVEEVQPVVAEEEVVEEPVEEPAEETEEIEILSQNPDFADEPIEEVEEPAEEVEEPVEEVAEPVEEPAEEVAEPVEEVAEPEEEPVEEVAEPVEEPVEEVAEPVEEVTEAEEEPVEEVAEPVEEPVEEVTEPVEEVTEAVEEPAEEVAKEEVVSDVASSNETNDEINSRLANIETNIMALMHQKDEEDEEDDEDEEEEVDIATVKSVRPRMTFMTKLRLASDEIKDFYTQIKNELLSYGFRNRVSKTKENFNHSRDTKARLVINGKTMKLYLALDPKTLDEKYYHHKDVSDKKGVAEIPTAMPIRSKLAVKKAKELIAKLAEACELAKKPRFKDKDFSEELSAEGMTLTERKGYGYLVRDSITLEQAEQLPDELADQLTDVQEEASPLRFIKQTISLDEIVAQFDDGDIVTIETIREGGIGVQNANYLIVEDGAMVNKKLKLYVDEITPNAIKMVTLAGGEVYKIWRKR